MKACRMGIMVLLLLAVCALSTQAETLPSYTQYRAQYAGAVRDGGSLTLEADAAVPSLEDEEAVWHFNIETAGLYAITLTYQCSEGIVDMERALKLNGAVPFEEAGSLTLHRLWENADMENGAFRKDKAGNELQPAQVQAKDAVTYTLLNTASAYCEPYYFYLDAGENTLALEGLRGDLWVQRITLQAASAFDLMDYQEYAAAPGDAYQGALLYVQGEAATLKSASFLQPQSDRSSAATQPSDATLTRLNTIGGASWSEAGQWIEWTVDAPAAGYYALGIRFRQNILSGMFTTRTLLVNGSIPFTQAACMEFPYGTAWQGKTLGELIYLEEGANTIRLRAGLGRAAELFEQAEESVLALNNAYRHIIMLTSTSPDPQRNYRIDKQLPDVMKTFEEQATAIRALSETLTQISGGRGSFNTVLDNLGYQLESFLEKPITIPSRLDSFKDNVSALASWLYQLSSQTLEVDYLVLGSAADVEHAMVQVNASFFQQAQYELQALAGSYTADYGISDSASVTADRRIEVWVKGGRDQANIIKRMADDTFTQDTGIAVDVRIAGDTSGVSGMLLATIAGLGPDVALFVSNQEPVNYASRTAAVDVSGFAGFDELTESFRESALTPYRYNGGVYALPLTETYLVMYYRQDILDEMGLQPPTTWDELYILIGELQKKHMTVGLPASLSSLLLHLYQQGGTLYSAAGDKCLLNEQKALTIFQEWMELYTSYGLPVDYDAANRFRTGEMPLFIANLDYYSTIAAVAPELNGLWTFCQVPGTERADAGVSHATVSTGSAMMLLSTCEDTDAAWQFMRWFAGAAAQSEYAQRMESKFGILGRYAAANLDALKTIPWTRQEYEKLMLAGEETKGIPEVPGGYYVTRYVDSALRNVTSYGTSAQEVLKEYAATINEEIAAKRKEFGLQ